MKSLQEKNYIHRKNGKRYGEWEVLVYGHIYFFSCFPESNEKSFVRLGKSIAEAYQQRDRPHLCNNFELCSAHFYRKFMYCR